MNERLPRIALVLCMVLAGAHDIAANEHTGQGCAAFTWKVDRVLEVMRGAPTALEAGADAGALEVGKHYALRLAPQADVKFPLAPARAASGANPRAGVFRFRVPESGRYRIALSTRHWIDVLAGDVFIDSVDHQGRSGCAPVHKIVEFELAAGVEYVLQLSGRDDTVAGLAITAA